MEQQLAIMPVNHRFARITVAIGAASLCMLLLLALRAFSVTLFSGPLDIPLSEASAFGALSGALTEGVYAPLAPLGLVESRLGLFRFFPLGCLVLWLVGLVTHGVSARRRKPAAMPWFTRGAVVATGVCVAFLLLESYGLFFVGPFEGTWHFGDEFAHGAMRYVRIAVGDVIMLTSLMFWVPAFALIQSAWAAPNRSRWEWGYRVSLAAIVMVTALTIRTWEIASGAALTVLQVSPVVPPSQTTLAADAHAGLGTLYVGMMALLVMLAVALVCAVAKRRM